VEIAGLEAGCERRVVPKDKARRDSGKRQIISIILPGDTIGMPSVVFGHRFIR
jgi:hypothetical protein